MISSLSRRSEGTRVTRREMMRAMAGVSGLLASRQALSAAQPNMKITGMKTFVVGNPWKNWLFIKVETDSGLFGWGEATSGLETKAPEAQVHELSRFVIGENPLYPERLWQRMYKGLFLGTNVAMSGIAIACWDILGKSLNAPVWKLLGGKLSPSLRVYANGWYKGPREPGAFAERASEVKSMGYTALKFDPFGSAYRFFDSGEEKKSLAIVAAVRRAVGDDMDILVEGHDRFSVSTAIRVGRQLEEYRPMWFETPVMSNDIAATLEVARAIKVPVATGERFSRLREFEELLAGRAVDIVQPETLKVGGIGGARKAAAVAEAAEAFVALHQAQSPYNTAINAHINATIPNFLIQECFDDFLEPWARDLMRGVPRVRNGYLEPPDAPGLGVEFDEKEMAKHPYGSNNFLRLFEDGWEKRTGGVRK
ncbi:MAG: mandelate racemase/muconate lactonizing enzyme family protein [Bryobacterales bacterium]|nr:mandelate racemase/muconate lactonizing enzyme family protein [Bryobacterales bacterium]